MISTIVKRRPGVKPGVHVGARIKATMDARNIKAETVSKWLGCEVNNVFKLYNKAIWDTFKLELISTHSGIPVGYFLADKSYSQPDTFYVAKEEEIHELKELRSEVDRLKSELVKSKDRVIELLEKNSNSPSHKKH